MSDFASSTNHIDLFANDVYSALEITHGRGAHVYSRDGKKFIDYYCSDGSLLLGHQNERVQEAFRSAIDVGLTEKSIHGAREGLRELLCARLVGVNEICFVSDESMVVESAIDIARKQTGRSKFVVVNENVIPDVDGTHAAIVVEPIRTLRGIIHHEQDFLSDLQAVCHQNGALLIFDERRTGFRLSYGGATELFGITPDLICLGNVIGGGYPLSAVGGRREIMAHPCARDSSNLISNALAFVAGLASLAALDATAYEMLQGRVDELSANIAKMAESTGVPVHLAKANTMLSLFFSDDEISNEADAEKSAGNGMYDAFARGMIRRGVLVPPSPFSPWCVSLSHDWQDIDWTTDLLCATLADIAG